MNADLSLQSLRDQGKIENNEELYLVPFYPSVRYSIMMNLFGELIE